ncbi:voltage-dependent calcium channel gamma-6 subunit isoform X2 [Castor canadensis]|uniref:Voltage-dependent calcium channel gamma-6 subunit isoform X2 n=1 Tax=Castor canadensis TaxID=51338 RepID=A0A8B7VDX2_CASCN
MRCQTPHNVSKGTLHFLHRCKPCSLLTATQSILTLVLGHEHLLFLAAVGTDAPATAPDWRLYSSFLWAARKSAILPSYQVPFQFGKFLSHCFRLCGFPLYPEANCTYFKFFTTGENARIFQRTTKKEVNLAAAAIAVLGLAVMALGCLCIIMVLSKGAEFLLRVGAVCFGLSGLLLFVSLEVFRHSVQALLQEVSPEPPPAPSLTYEYSWSLGCGVGAGLILLLGGGCFLLLTLPSWPWGSLCLKRGHSAA